MKFTLEKIVVFVVLIGLVRASKEYDDLKKKSVVDYSEADLEKLYDQWEVYI